jgi:hypothetical protein
MKSRRDVVLFVLSMALAGCGAPHVTTAPGPVGLPEYKAAFVDRVTVASQEPNAQTNEPLQQKMREWQAQTRQQLQDGLRAHGYVVLSELPAQPTDAVVLIINCDVDVKYGNRAVRWAVGFGAGKGGVRSIFVGVDRQTGAERFRTAVASDLAMGGAGGDMGAVVKDNIAKLAADLPHAGM